MKQPRLNISIKIWIFRVVFAPKFRVELWIRERMDKPSRDD